MNIPSYPKCGKCQSDMLPFEDTAPNTGATYIKGWVCSNPECPNTLMFKAGTLYRPKIETEKER